MPYYQLIEKNENKARIFFYDFVCFQSEFKNRKQKKSRIFY